MNEPQYTPQPQYAQTLPGQVADGYHAPAPHGQGHAIPELQDMALKLAAIADMLDQRSQQAVNTAAHGAQQLQYVAQGLNQQGQQMVQTVIGAVSANAKQAIEAGTAEALEKLRKELQQAQTSAGESAKVIAEQAKALQKSQKNLVARGGIALLVGAVVVALTSAYFAWHTRQQFKQADFAQDILDAANSGAITRCGDDGLCVRIGENPTRYGRKGEFVLLDGVGAGQTEAPASTGK